MESLALDRHRAFVSCYARASESLRAYVLALVSDRHQAEDVIQDLALTLWERFDDYDAAGAIPRFAIAWIALSKPARSATWW
ncbi:MAG: sigma factor [Planctomycetota bacterium]|jgi:DNA-directed RNA polymerase specialized sigma24 family protein|nr:sigma factor [Planctomycetota bacterium]